jgi:outer membrane lipoprotein carrier protein
MNMSIRSTRGRVCASLLLLLLPSVNLLAADTAMPPRLERFFADLVSLEANFEQEQVDAQTGERRQASGIFVLVRPGKFRWDYLDPYKQLILADGEKIWIYDPDLEQVIVKQARQALGDMPAQLLSSTQPLNESFDIFQLEDVDGMTWFRLEPVAKDSTVEAITLGFDRDHLRVMELNDAFGQQTRIQFLNVKRNPAINPARLTFVPPPGVDVVGE